MPTKSRWLGWVLSGTVAVLLWSILRWLTGLLYPKDHGKFFVHGRYLYDPSGNKVILRGVNKMSVYEKIEDSEGAISFPEIRKTGANSVRIVWKTTPDTPATRAVLDALITNAKNNKLIPMIELHDATGDWSGLKGLVDYWVQPAIVSIIQKHQRYLLVNIGNEVGKDTVTDNDFIAGYVSPTQVGYKYAIQTMRAAGIHTPLVIDAPDWGKKLKTLNNTAATLLGADPDNNLIFSVHLYWPMHEGAVGPDFIGETNFIKADANFIKTRLQEAVDRSYPLIVGEFSQWGAPNQGPNICTGGGEIDYQAILAECDKHGIGWYAWEWGPGNGYVPKTETEPERYDGPCQVMDMTPDRMFANLKQGWAEKVAISSPYSIKNTSVTHL